MRQGFKAQSLAGLHTAAGGGQVLSIECQRHLLNDLPHRHLSKQCQTDHQPERVVGGQLAPADGCLAGGAQRLFDPGRTISALSSLMPPAGKHASVSFNVFCRRFDK